jgi:hypothetical protein
MKLSHSIAMTTLCFSFGAFAAACGEEAEPGGGTGGAMATGGTATGGTATGGTATGGTATGGTATGGTATGGASGSGTTGGSGGSGGSGGGGFNDHPTDSSQAGIEAFLAANSYTMTGMGWRPETMATDGTGVPHKAVKRYFNETLIASRNAMMTGNMSRTGSMTVKDLLNGTTVVGKAAMLRTDTAWVYYCMSSEEGRCKSGSEANVVYYGSASVAGCACHSSGLVLSGTAIPM